VSRGVNKGQWGKYLFQSLKTWDRGDPPCLDGEAGNQKFPEKETKTKRVLIFLIFICIIKEYGKQFANSK